MGSNSLLDDFQKIKISCPCRESNHNSPAVLPAAWSLYKLHYPRAEHIYKLLSSRFQSHREVIKFQGLCFRVWSADTLIVLQSDRPTLSLCYSLIADTLIVLQSDRRHMQCANRHTNQDAVMFKYKRNSNLNVVFFNVAHFNITYVIIYYLILFVSQSLSRTNDK